jgi:hypothetical protein
MRTTSIPGFPDYLATEEGRIASVRTGRLLRGSLIGKWLYVSLRRDGRTHTRPVHRLVALAFLGPCPRGLVCRHLDGDTRNNRPENLTYRRLTSEERNPRRRRLSAADRLAIVEMRAAGYHFAAIAQKFGCSIPTVYHICW